MDAVRDQGINAASAAAGGQIRVAFTDSSTYAMHVCSVVAAIAMLAGVLALAAITLWPRARRGARHPDH